MGFEMICSGIIVAVLLASLFWVYRRHRMGKSEKSVKSSLLLQILCFCGVGAAMVAFGFHQALAAGETAETVAGAVANGVTDTSVAMLAAALATGLSGIGGGIAVSASASAALGAISENEKMFGRSMIFVGLAEGIALYGLIISLMILSRI